MPRACHAGLRIRVPAAAFISLVLGVLAAGCGEDPGTRPPDAPPEQEKDWEPLVDGAWILETTRSLTDIGPRPPGSAGNIEARLFIEKTLRESGFPREHIHRQTWTEPTPDPADTGQGAAADGSDFTEETTFSNIIAVIPGKDPRGVALAAHYDSKTSLEFEFVGANDAASSVAIVLELARILKRRAGEQPREHALYFIFFDGEESIRWDWRDPDNRYGSRHFVEEMKAQGEDFPYPLNALVLVDMVGSRDLVYADEENADPEILQIMKETSREVFGIVPFATPRGGSIQDDHVSFKDTDVRVFDLIHAWFDDRGRQDPPWWHTPEDTVENLDRRSLERSGTLLLEALPRIEKAVNR